MINDASVVIGGGNWGIKEADVLGYKLINDEYYAREIDFANSTAAGTYTDSTGVIRKAPYNLVTSSSDFSQSYSLLNSTITTNTITDPFGTLLGDSQLETIATDVHAGYNDYTAIVGSQYTYSVYVKSINGRDVRVSGSSGFDGPVAVVNLSNGAILSSAGTIQVTNAGNGWYRISITATATTTTARILIYSTVGTQLTFAGDVTKGVYLFGRQLVEGTEALPYFPTTTRLNVPRIDYRNADGSLSTVGRLLLEPQRTNSIRNSSMVGAVAGSPGTIPTNWSLNGVTGLTQTVVGIGTENGLPYIDLRYSGTAISDLFRIQFESSNAIAATNGQTWSESFYIKSISGTLPQLNQRITLRNAAFAVLTSVISPDLLLTSTLSRQIFTSTLANASVAFVQPEVQISFAIGTTYDFTIRIAAPQMELGAYATTWIPTTTASVTRNADAASRTGVSSWIGQTEGTLFVDIIPTDVSTTNAIGINAASTSDRILIFTGSGLIFGQVRVGGVTQFTINTSASVGARYKAALAYKGSDFAFYLNGNQIGVSSTGTVPACSVISYDTGTGVSPFVGRNNQAALFPTRLTNEQLSQLTTL